MFLTYGLTQKIYGLTHGELHLTPVFSDMTRALAFKRQIEKSDTSKIIIQICEKDDNLKDIIILLSGSHLAVDGLALNAVLENETLQYELLEIQSLLEDLV